MSTEITKNTHKSITLPDDVAKHFEISGENARRKSHWRKHIKIDLNTISLAKAKQLVEEGFPYLKAKASSTEASAKAETSAKDLSSLEGGGQRPEGDSDKKSGKS